MLKINLILFLLIISMSAFAQVNNFNVEDTLIEVFEAKLTGIVISPDVRINEKCIIMDWCQSEITLYNGEIVYGKNLKYNGFDDSFIWLVPTTFLQTRLEREFIKEVKMKLSSNNEYLVFKLVHEKEVVPAYRENVFLNVLVEGNVSLYVFRKIEYYNNADYETNYQYYLKKQDGNFEEFKPNKANLLAKLPERKKEIQKIIKTHRLSVKKEKDLKKAFELLNLEL